VIYVYIYIYILFAFIWNKKNVIGCRNARCGKLHN